MAFSDEGVTYPNALLSSGDVFAQAAVRTTSPWGQRCSEKWAVTPLRLDLRGRQALCWDWFILIHAQEQLPQLQLNWWVASYIAKKSHERHLTFGCEPPAWFMPCIPRGDFRCTQSVPHFSSVPYAFGDTRAQTDYSHLKCGHLCPILQGFLLTSTVGAARPCSAGCFRSAATSEEANRGSEFSW